MSSWQSFFNQLSRPQKNPSLSMMETICNCEGGTLTQSPDLSYQYSGVCSPKCFCAVIEQDRRDARKYTQSISLTQTNKEFNSEDEKNEKNSLERLFDQIKTIDNKD